MDNILNTIFEDTCTLSQLRHRLKILKSELSRTFFEAGDIESLTPADANWFNKLPKAFLGSFNKDNMSQALNDLTSNADKIPVLTVYLPFEASDEVLTQIGMKARNTFGKKFLLDIKYNPSLIAGCALSWKGIYKDYSIHNRINERKLAILQNLKKFIR